MTTDDEPTHTPAQLRGAAHGQRVVLAMAFVQTFLVVAFVLAAWTGAVADPRGDWQITVGVAASLVGVAAGAAVVSLAGKLYGAAAGVVLGMLTAVPCLGLAVIFVVSVLTNGVFRRHGVRVGLFGANPADLAALDWEVRGGYVPEVEDGW